MKQQKYLLGIFLIITVLAACSDNDTDDTTSSAQAANTTSAAPATETLKSDALQKRSDAAAKRLKDKVQMMTETVHATENTGKFSLKQVYKYDKNGNQLELSEYTPDGNLNSTKRSIYDSVGKVVSEETILSTGEVAFRSTIKTDQNGNKVEENIRQGKGNNKLANSKYIYKYDEKANLLEWLALKGTGAFFFKYSFVYDANGNRTDWLRLTETNAPFGKTSYKYDDKNNKTEETIYNPDGSVKESYSYTYEFDKKGNWVKQRKIQNGTVVELRKREYKYY